MKEPYNVGLLKQGNIGLTVTLRTPSEHPEKIAREKIIEALKREGLPEERLGQLLAITNEGRCLFTDANPESPTKGRNKVGRKYTCLFNVEGRLPYDTYTLG